MEINYYQRAAAIFAQEDNLLMSCNLYVDALKTDKFDAMLWLYLGHSLISFSLETRNTDMLDKGFYCVLEGYKLDPDNIEIKNAIKIFETKPFFAERIKDCPNFTFQEIEILKKDIKDEELITFFTAINSLDDKIALLIYLGETKDEKYYPLLKYCIESIDNQHIKFAALKRIHFFSKNKDLKNIFQKIILENKRKDYEPYFSMALSKIDEEWARDLVKDSEINISIADKVGDKVKKDLQYDIINEDYLNAMIFASLSRYNFYEIQKFINAKDYRMLIVLLLGEFPQSGQELFYKNNIIQNGQITEFGWKKINEFAQNQNLVENQSKISEEKIENAKSKWWQIWK